MIIFVVIIVAASNGKGHTHASHWIVEHDILSSQFQQHGIIEELGYAHIL
jgi:general stress protein CsbA